MRKEFRKFAITFVIAIIMTMVLSVGAQAAVNVSSGDGSESSPYEITVSGASEELLEYQLHPDSENKYYFASRIKLKATEIVQITIKDVKGEGNYFRIEREGKDNGASGAKFIVRSGETLNVKATARSGGVSTMKITAKVVSNEEYCPKDISGIHDFYQGECRYRCGYQCKHPRESRRYIDQYEITVVNGVSKHMRSFKCSECDLLVEDPADAQACTVEKWSKESAERKEHHGTCTVCGKEVYMACEYNKTKYTKINESAHNVSKQCSICGGYDGSYYYKSEKHAFKKNVCTKCKFKRVMPGTLKISSLKQKGKKKKTHYTVEAHWEKRGSTYYWIPAKKATSYEYKLYYKIRSKNAKKYIISLNPNWKASGDWMLSTKKKSFTYKFYRSTPIKKLTLYLTPVSKTDTPGKTVKRVVKFS